MRTSFGRFTFDDTSGELFDGAATARLAPQVASVLSLLLASAGELVTREQFKAALWPDTTVEFDDGLNFCIRQLRLALDDDASQPRFVETLPRRGYRFIGAIPPAPAIAPAQALAPANPTAPAESRLRVMSRSRTWLAVATLVIAAALTLGLRWRSDRAPGRAAIVIAVMPFNADSADPAARAFQRALSETLVSELTNTAGTRADVVGPLSTSRFSGLKSPVESLAAAFGATHVLSGSVTHDSTGMRLFAQLVRVNDRKHIYAARFTGPAGDSVAAGVLRKLDLAPSSAKTQR